MPVQTSDFDMVLLSILRKLPADKIQDYQYVSEGINNRIKQASGRAESIKNLVELVDTKRFTTTRIMRIVFCVLLGLKKHHYETFMQYDGPQYARILGFTDKGRQLLSKIADKATIPIVTKTANYQRSCNPLFKEMLEFDALSTDLYVLSYKNPAQRHAGQDFSQKIIIV
jgi:predicted nucleotidyltransferase